MRKPKVDESLCIGCGNCSATTPEVFEMEGATARVKDLADYEVYTNGVDDAIAGCPVGAISWQDGNNLNPFSESEDSSNEAIESEEGIVSESKEEEM